MTKPGTLEDLKDRLLQRAKIGRRPIKPPVRMEDVELFLSRLKSTDRDHWAEEWSRMAEPWEKKGDEFLKAGKKKEAMDAYYHAYRFYYLGRYPVPNSPGKKKAYQNSLRNFLSAARLFDPPIELVTIPFDGKEIVGYLRLPKDVVKPPLVFFLGGTDSWKEDDQETIGGFLSSGWGCFVIDIPGTGESPILAKADSDRVFSTALDYLQTRVDIDGTRIAITGTSFGGYWATKIAYVEYQRIRAAVNWGGPAHLYFQPEWQQKTLQESEYLTDWFEAQAALYGVSTEEAYLEAIPKLSLQNQGILGNPSAPLLCIQGKNDTLIPVSDIYLLMEKGSPKTAWINPEGAHMGISISTGFTLEYIKNMVILPWLRIHLSSPSS